MSTNLRFELMAVRTVGNSHLIRAGLLLVASLIATNGFPVLAQHDAVRNYQGHADTNSWTVHVDKGSVFASVNSTNEVIEHDMHGHEVAKFSVGPQPVQMLIKGHNLVVACRGDAVSALSI